MRWATKQRLNHPCSDKAKSNLPEYKAYKDAKPRCLNPRNAALKNYCGRGIEFKFKHFWDFLAAVGRRPSPQYSIDRINNNGPYSPSNCKWSTSSEQSRNKRERTHCKKCGMPWDAANPWLGRNGHRHCWACSRRRALESYRRQALKKGQLIQLSLWEKTDCLSAK